MRRRVGIVDCFINETSHVFSHCKRFYNLIQPKSCVCYSVFRPGDKLRHSNLVKGLTVLFVGTTYKHEVSLRLFPSSVGRRQIVWVTTRLVTKSFTSGTRSSQSQMTVDQSLRLRVLGRVWMFQSCKVLHRRVRHDIAQEVHLFLSNKGTKDHDSFQTFGNQIRTLPMSTNNGTLTFKLFSCSDH